MTPRGREPPIFFSSTSFFYPADRPAPVKGTTVVMLVATMVAPFALATHTPQGDCDGGDAPSLGLVQVGEGDGAFYVDDRSYLFGNGIWVYEETNGVWAAGDPAHSLQRGGASFLVPDDRETCVDDPLAVPDALYV